MSNHERSGDVNTQSAEVVRRFFAAFASGDGEALVATFHPEAEIVAVRDGAREAGGPYGRYRGHAGVREMVAALGATFETEAFTVDGVLGEGEVAFASGRFAHRVKATGRLFQSAWALRCVVKDGRIREYRFYEDSAAFAEASGPKLQP